MYAFHYLLISEFVSREVNVNYDVVVFCTKIKYVFLEYQ